MLARYLGHSCLWVNINSKSVLIDPFIRANPKASHIDISSLKPDYVLLTHGHEDHIADAEEILNNSSAELIANFEIVNWFAKKGITKAQALNPGGKISRDFGEIQMTAAVHSSSMPDGSYGGVAGGFILSSEEGSFYHSGDTALSVDMQLIGERHQLDWAALCLGDVFTMGIDDAIECAHMVGVSKVLGIHYDTFDAIAIDRTQAISAFHEAGIELLLTEVGEILEL